MSIEKIRVCDEHIMHTSNPEYEPLGSYEHMEKLRDRTVKVDIPFLKRWAEESSVPNKPLTWRDFKRQVEAAGVRDDDIISFVEKTHMAKGSLSVWRDPKMHVNIMATHRG